MTQQKLLETPKYKYAIMQDWPFQGGTTMSAFSSTSLKKAEAEFKRRKSLGFPVTEIVRFEE